MTSRKIALITVALALLAAPLLSWAQGAPAYRIEAVEYRIDGKTREGPLGNNLELKIGRSFPDLASLEAYVADRRQVLANQRIFESSDMTYTLGGEDEGVVLVTLIVSVKDTWNLIVLPYPKYTTNDGFLLSLRARNYNFLGSMETLYLDLNYVYDENGDTSFGVGVDFTLPFELGGLDWSVNTDQAFSIDLSGLITYTDANTLDLYFRMDSILWTLSFGQNIYWNQDGSDDDDLNKMVMQSLVGLSAEIGLFPLGSLGTMTLTPNLEAGWKYLALGGDISEDRRGPYITTAWSLDAGRADWVGNFRHGLVLQLMNSYTYNLLFEDWSVTLTGQAQYFDSWANRLGLNSRLTLYTQVTNDTDNDIGSYMRGIPDDDLDGDLAAFVNLDFPIRLFDFKPSLLVKKDWFDFEVHASPFVDAALVRAFTSDSFEPYLAGGLEVFGFLKRARSVYARLSLGVNALGYLDTRSFSGNYELFFGLGHDY